MKVLVRANNNEYIECSAGVFHLNCYQSGVPIRRLSAFSALRYCLHSV
jgi:hypothetical protein